MSSNPDQGPRLCSNCVNHCHEDQYSYCQHRGSDLVWNGFTRTPCHHNRHQQGLCGPEGRMFRRKDDTPPGPPRQRSFADFEAYAAEPGFTLLPWQQRAAKAFFDELEALEPKHRPIGVSFLICLIEHYLDSDANSKCPKTPHPYGAPQFPDRLEGNSNS